MHRDARELEAGLDEVRRSPRDAGTVELLVGRPAEDERELFDEVQLDVAEGLVGDNWQVRGSGSTDDGSANPEAQLTLTNSRSALLVAVGRERRALSGDQLYVDLDLSYENLPPGTRLSLGSAEIEITAKPHRGCGKFASRFGVEALKFVNSEVGRELNLRGTYAKVIRSGHVRVGDTIKTVS